MDIQQLEAAAQAAKELGITDLIPTIYQDVLQPAAREAGQKLVIVARAVGVALAPLEGVAWGYDQIKSVLADQVAARLANKAPDEIKTPDKAIAGPIVMGMAFASDAPHLREMYGNLLASAMHAPSAGRVHPSFVQIIQQLTPAEAQILKHISANYKASDALFREQIAVLETSESQMHSVVYRLMGSMAGHATISDAWQSLCAKSGITDGVIANAFFRNFVRLGILDERVETSSGSRFGIGERMMSRTAGAGNRLWRKVELTEYGNLFLDVCVREL